MSEAPRMDGAGDADTSAMAGPAAANTADGSGELGPQIAAITKELSVDVLASKGLSVTEASGPALITYEKSTTVGGGRVGETIVFEVGHDSDERGVGVQYRDTYYHPNGSRPINEVLEELNARVDTNAEHGGVLSAERRISDMGHRIAPEGFRPKPESPEDVQLQGILSGLQEHPGLVTVNFKSGAPTSRPNQADDHERGSETDIFEREATAKRSIYTSAGAIMEHFRPGVPYKVMLDIQRNERQDGDYGATPDGSLRILAPFYEGQPARSIMLEIYEALLIQKPHDVVDEAETVGVVPDTHDMLSFVTRGPDQSSSMSMQDYFGITFAPKEAKQFCGDPEVTDKQVVAIQETLARALSEVVDRLGIDQAQSTQESGSQA